MKKIAMICFTLVIAVLLSTTICAQEEQTVRGIILKIDAATKSVTLKKKDDTVITVVLDDPKMLSRVKEDMKAEAKYVVKDGINASFKIRKLIEGCE